MDRAQRQQERSERMMERERQEREQRVERMEHGDGAYERVSNRYLDPAYGHGYDHAAGTSVVVF